MLLDWIRWIQICKWQFINKWLCKLKCGDRHCMVVGVSSTIEVTGASWSSLKSSVHHDHHWSHRCIMIIIEVTGASWSSLKSPVHHDHHCSSELDFIFCQWQQVCGLLLSSPLIKLTSMIINWNIIESGL
jgi:hypothetical protein